MVAHANFEHATSAKEAAAVASDFPIRTGTASTLYCHSCTYTESWKNIGITGRYSSTRDA